VSAPNLRDLPGLKRRDIKPCALCGKGVMHGGQITFYRLTLDRYVVDMHAIERQHGLEQFMGSPAIAHAMGPDEDLAKQLPEGAGPVLVCQWCAMAPHALMSLAALDPDPARLEEFDQVAKA
jgi:hypothetical protein